MTTNRKPWSDAENRRLVALYFHMLTAARLGASYNKAEMIRQAQGTEEQPGILFERTRGSIESKLMNASAAHRDLDPMAETMDGHGYRALSNYQSALRIAMAEALAQSTLERAAL